MQPAADDVVDRARRPARSRAAPSSCSTGVAEHAGRRAGDRVHRLARRHQAVAGWRAGTRGRAAGTRRCRSGEMRPCRLRYISNALAERSTAAHWMSSTGVPTSCDGRQQEEVLHVEDARGLVGALEHAARAGRSASASPCVIVASVTPANSWLAMLDRREQLLRVGQPLAVCGGVVHHQVELVELLPHLRRDDLAHRAGVLARRAQARDDRVRVLRVERQELDDVLLRRARRSASRTPRCRRWCRRAAATAGRRPRGRSSIRLRFTSMKRATFSARST